jgi:galactokinase
VKTINPIYETREALRLHVAKVFEGRFGAIPEAVTSAPGRVNLIGEHTDYNGGYVLPMTLNMEVAVAIGSGFDAGAIDVYSETKKDMRRRSIDENATGHWSDYVLGSLRLSYGDQVANSGCCVAVAGTLPIGRGISSSAALEVAMIKAVAAVSNTCFEPAEIARMARRVENDFVGMPCGIMDQFAAVVGSYGKAVFLDTRSLEFETVPLFEGFGFVVVGSGVKHRLTEGSYAERVAECKAACAALGVNELRDCDMADLDRIDKLDPPLNRRARHVVTENRRVLDAVEAMKAGDVAAFGRLMIESHVSQRDDYRVSVPEIDALVEAALAAGAIGARLTGGGFGGSIVALVETVNTDTFCRKVLDAFPQASLLAVT